MTLYFDKISIFWEDEEIFFYVDERSSEQQI